MNQLSELKNDLKLEIYESAYNNLISTDDRDFLLAILEMKSAKEYRESKFKHRFKFKADPKNPDKGTIRVGNDEFMVDIGHSPNIIVRDNGDLGRLNRVTSNVLIGGEIILDFDTIMKMRNRERIDGIVYHEIGHNKFHGVTQSPKNYRVVTNADSTLSDNIIDEIVEATRRQRTHNNMTKRELDLLNNFLNSLREYLTIKMNLTKFKNVDKSKMRETAIEYYKQFEKEGHTNLKEFEADRYATNKVGTKAMTHGMVEYEKKINKAANRKGSTADTSQRSKVLRDPKTVLNKDAYK